MNVGDLGKLIVAKGFISYPKSNKSPYLVTLMTMTPSGLTQQTTANIVNKSHSHKKTPTTTAPAETTTPPAETTTAAAETTTAVAVTTTAVAVTTATTTSIVNKSHSHKKDRQTGSNKRERERQTEIEFDKDK